MNVRDPFNVRNLNRNPVATWRPRTNSRAQNDGLTALQHIIRTAATATQAAASDFRDKAGEVVLSAQQVLNEAAVLDDRGGGRGAGEPGDHRQPQHRQHQGQQNDQDMSFTVPRNVPSFSSPQRQLEDQLWAAKFSSRQRSLGGGGVGGVLGDVQDFLSPRNRAALPMYKDKPYMYPPGRGGARRTWLRPVYRRRRACCLLLLLVVGLVWWSGLLAGQREVAVTKLNQWGLLGEEGGVRDDGVDWLSRREQVVEAAKLSWDAYERYAWGEWSRLASREVGAGWERRPGLT